MNCKRGFLPCFSRYLFKVYPIENLYNKTQYVEKVKILLSNFIDCESTVALKNKGIGKEIQVVRPDNLEGIRIINQCSFQNNLYRIDYGNNSFRVIFGLSNENRLAYIFGFDLTHSTYSGKQKR